MEAPATCDTTLACRERDEMIAPATCDTLARRGRDGMEAPATCDTLACRERDGMEAPATCQPSLPVYVLVFFKPEQPFVRKGRAPDQQSFKEVIQGPGRSLGLGTLSTGLSSPTDQQPHPATALVIRLLSYDVTLTHRPCRSCPCSDICTDSLRPHPKPSSRPSFLQADVIQPAC